MGGAGGGETGTTAAAGFSPNRWSVRSARHWVASVLGEWGEADRFADAELVVSELVSNAVVHGSGEVSLRLALDGPSVRVEVDDRGAGAPQIRDVTADAPGGRGLVMVSALSESWGVTPLPGGGKTVWAVLTR